MYRKESFYRDLLVMDSNRSVRMIPQQKDRLPAALILLRSVIPDFVTGLNGLSPRTLQVRNRPGRPFRSTPHFSEPCRPFIVGLLGFIDARVRVTFVIGFILNEKGRKPLQF